MNKVILVGLDGFRPEMLDPATTPNLAALAHDGLRFGRFRAVFPSDTYVNLVSLATGRPPGGHGIVANAFLDPRIDRRQAWSGSRLDLVEAGMAAYRGALVDAPTLGDRLAAAGRRLWVLSSNSAGSARLKHPRVAGCAGHLLLAAKDWASSLPRALAAQLAERLGPPPAPVPGDAAPERYLTEAFLLLAREAPLPDATLLWFDEPDRSYHAYGLGAAATLAALRAADAELGRLLDWRSSRPDRAEIQILVLSDHGHVTQSGRVDCAGIFRAAGLRVAEHLEEGADLALVPGYSGNLRVRGGDPGRLAAAAEALMAHPEAGLVFTRGGPGPEGAVPGTFGLALAGLDHARAPDLFFTLGADDRADPYGFLGTCRHDDALPDGVGYHGGLHPGEMGALLLASGEAFAGGRESALPASIVDLLPTVLSLLGLPTAGTAGRVLGEAFGPGETAPAETQVFRASRGRYVQELRTLSLGRHRYLDCGRRVS